MLVAMMDVVGVGVGVLERFVPVHVAVLAAHRHVVLVSVVPIIVTMSMIVLEWLVPMSMGVRLGRVEVDGDRKEQRRDDDERDALAIAERERDGRADERREREDGAGARGAERTLRTKIEAQAEAVAGRAAQDERDRGRP